MLRKDILLNLLSAAQNIQALLGNTCSRPEFVDESCKNAIPVLELSAATERFTNDLSCVKAFPRVRQRAYESVNQLQTQFNQSYENCCLRLLSTTARPRAANIILFEQLRKSYEARYEQELTRLMTIVRESMSKIDILQRGQKRRPAFNHRYTPLLEKYFRQNAYPSSNDRLLLARETQMTPRQIEVWFQNHRNRSKKDGRSLARITSPSYDTFFESLRAQPLAKFTTDSRSSSDDSDISDSEIVEDDSKDDICISGVDSSRSDVFSSSTPAHAYPNIYPPKCDENPFPNDKGVFTFPSPVWIRTPSKTIREASSLISVDDLAGLFAEKLNLKGSCSSKETSYVGRSKTSSKLPWFAATTVFLSPAPHPAFVKSTPRPIRASNMVTSSPQSLLQTSASNLPSKQYPFPTRLPDLPFRSSAFTSRNTSSDSISTFSSRSSSFSSLASVEPSTPPPSPRNSIQPIILTSQEEEIFGSFFGLNASDIDANLLLEPPVKPTYTQPLPSELPYSWSTLYCVPPSSVLTSVF